MLSFTSKDLVLYLYNESPPEQQADIQLALEMDWDLREKYEMMRYAQKRLGGAKYSPSKRAVAHILHYADRIAREITEEV